MANRRRRRRRRRDGLAIFLRLVIVLLLAFIIGLIVWFALHDRDVRSGVTALKKGKYEEAIACFDSSIAAGEDVAESYRGKGLAYYELKKYKRARKALIQSIDEGAPATGEICNLIGLCYMEYKDYEKSLEWFREGLAAGDVSDELTKEMRYQTIICCEKTAQWELAKENAETYIADYPEDDQMAREYRFLESR